MTIKIPIFGEVNLLKLFYEILFAVGIFFMPILTYINHLNRKFMMISIFTFIWAALIFSRDKRIINIAYNNFLKKIKPIDSNNILNIKEQEKK